MGNDDKKSSLSALTGSDATPEVRMRVLDERIKERRDKLDHEINDKWESCCFSCDRRVIQYFTQMTILSAVMGFCMYQLITNDSCEAQTGYTGLLTLLLGLIVPAPSIKR